jgi:tetrapyrrole methylase family protein/MazG family protein
LSKPIGEWSELVGIIEKLRSPDGCPWDMEQTHASLRPFLIEEAYEAVHAIDQADWDALRDELGDVLLQVVLHSQIGQEAGWFSQRDVIRSISEKMIRRHPHVFGDVTVRGLEDVHANWEAIKQIEKQSAQNEMVMHSQLAKVKEGLPPLAESYQLQEVAATLHFDWQDVEQVYEKVQEELIELRESAASSQQEEWGDLLFALINVARWLQIDPDEALRAANQKFRRRFLGVEKMLESNNMDFSAANFEVFMDFWDEVKRNEQK